MTINTNNIPIIIGFIIMFFILLAALLSPTEQITIEKTFEVIDVSTYYRPGGFGTVSDDGYIIKYLDGDEISSMTISSGRLTVRPTDNESYLIRNHIYQPISRYEYELYLNRFAEVD